MTTMGDLNRRFERDREFAVGDVLTGPAVTPSGSLNNEFKLVFGRYKAKKRPREIHFRGLTLYIGKNAARWVYLSSIEVRPVMSFASFVLAVKKNGKKWWVA